MISTAKRLIMIVAAITLICNAFVFIILGIDYNIGSWIKVFMIIIFLSAVETAAIGLNIAHWSKKLFW